MDTLGAAIDRIGNAMRTGSIQADDAAQRLLCTRTLEHILINLDSLDLSGSTPEELVACLLWYKHHPSAVDIDRLIAGISHSSPFVRVTAQDAVEAALNAGSEDRIATRRLLSALEAALMTERSLVLRLRYQRLMDQATRTARRSVAPELVINPFVAGPPRRDPEQVFGRTEALQQIGELLRAPEPCGVVVVGPRRIGKTSLLYSIRWGALGEDFHPVYVDLQPLVDAPAYRMLAEIVNAIDLSFGDRRREAFQSRVGSGDTIDFAELRYGIRVALSRSSQRRVLLLLDEYEILTANDQGQRVLAELSQNLRQQQRLCVLYAGASRRSLAGDNPLAELPVVTLGALGRDDVAQLIQQQCPPELDFSTEMVGKVYELAGGHPFYTQALCAAIVVNAGGRGSVEERHLAGALRSCVDNPPPHLLLGWKGLTLEQRLVASALAELQRTHDTWVKRSTLYRWLRAQRLPFAMTSWEFERALSRLRDQGWVDHNDEDGTYRHSLFVVRQWVAERQRVWSLTRSFRERAFSDAASLKRRIAALLIDGAIIVDSVMIIGGLSISTRDWWLWIALTYFPIVLFLFRTTPGMRLMYIEPVDEAGERLAGLRAMMFGAVRAAPWAILALVAVTSFEPGRQRLQVAATVLALLALITMTADCFALLVSRSQSGLLDRWTGVAVERRRARRLRRDAR